MTKPTFFLFSFALVDILGCATAAPQPTPPPPASLAPEWAPLRALVGNWTASGGDAAHPSQGTFTLEPDLGGKVLVRRSTNDAGAAHHEDLTIIYRTPSNAFEASYFDNEGHAIHYAITPSDDGRNVVFLSDDVSGTPRFRLTYAVTADDALAVTFDIAPPGSTQFQPYVKGVAHRAGAPAGRSSAARAR